MSEITIYTDNPKEWEELTKDVPSYIIIDLASFTMGVIEE
jgi:hypothetical protein